MARAGEAATTSTTEAPSGWVPRAEPCRERSQFLTAHQPRPSPLSWAAAAPGAALAVPAVAVLRARAVTVVPLAGRAETAAMTQEVVAAAPPASISKVRRAERSWRSAVAVVRVATPDTRRTPAWVPVAPTLPRRVGPARGRREVTTARTDLRMVAVAAPPSRRRAGRRAASPPSPAAPLARRAAGWRPVESVAPRTATAATAVRSQAVVVPAVAVVAVVTPPAAAGAQARAEAAPEVVVVVLPTPVARAATS